MRKFRFAGVSKVDGEWRLRASNRENYDEILARDKNTGIKLRKLSKPMTKDEIRKDLSRRKDFRTPQILRVLQRDDEAPVRKVARKKSKKAAPSEGQQAAA